MLRFICSLFSSPESLLQAMSQRGIAESIEEGERILIDEDGCAMVNFSSSEVHADFARHVSSLKKA